MYLLNRILNRVEILQGDTIYMKLYLGIILSQSEFGNILFKLVKFVITILADPSMKCSFMAIFGPQSRPAMS